MSAPSGVPALCRGLVRLSGLLVPRAGRSVWLAEWRAELHYVLGRGLSRRECLAFSLGAVPDAFWLRRHPLDSAPWLETPQRCLAVLACLAGVSLALGLLLPSVRRQIFPPACPDSDNIVDISQSPALAGSAMEVSAAQFLSWSSRAHPGISHTGFYRVYTAKLRLNGRAAAWSVGEASPELPAMLHLPVSSAALAACMSSGAMPIVLGRALWLRGFHADPKIAGRVLAIDGRRAVVVGVAPGSGEDLPMQVDAWSLISDQEVVALSANRFVWGYMLAQRTGPSAGVHAIELTSGDGSPVYLYAIGLSSFAEYRRHMPQLDFLLSLLLTGLMLPAILAISLQTGLKTERLSRWMRLRGWLFLTARVALLLPLLYCGPLLIAQALPVQLRDSACALQTFVTLAGSLYAAFWVIDDQRQRCPRCLRRLSSPARVGDRSRSFLGFSGMEFVCAEGHGLLHVPDYPTSWFASQRWLPLDPSWRGLFQHEG